MLQEIWSFIKNPVYEEDANTDNKYRLIILFKLLVISIVASIGLSSITNVVTGILNLELGKHAIEEVLESYSKWILFFAAVIFAPLLEEFFFRGPMVFYKNKSYFKYVFYFLSLTFGFVHLSNFEITTTTLLLSPLLVAPQISAGLLMGLIRIRFGLIWAMVLHALYNLVLIGPLVFF